MSKLVVVGSEDICNIKIYTEPHRVVAIMKPVLHHAELLALAHQFAAAPEALGLLAEIVAHDRDLLCIDCSLDHGSEGYTYKHHSDCPVGKAQRLLAGTPEPTETGGET